MVPQVWDVLREAGWEDVSVRGSIEDEFLVVLDWLELGGWWWWVFVFAQRRVQDSDDFESALTLTRGDGMSPAGHTIKISEKEGRTCHITMAKPLKTK